MVIVVLVSWVQARCAGRSLAFSIFLVSPTAGDGSAVRDLARTDGTAPRPSVPS